MLVSVLAGFLVGFLAAYLLLRGRIEKRIARSRLVVKGRVAEQLAPLLPQFKYKLSDARFLGSPVDYIVFDGYSEAAAGAGKPITIVFLEVKTGGSSLSPAQKKLREAVEKRRVRWETLRLG